MASLVDSYQRRFKYLRLSITDSCNFRCAYCLPNGNCIDPSQGRPLSVDEIRNLAEGFAELGVQKIRITGGEPTLRRDVVEIFRVLSEVAGVKELALSTNGYRLQGLAPRLKEAGCRAVNVSLDSLNPEKFQSVTSWNNYADVLKGIDASLEVGLRVKVNSVLMKGINDESLPEFLEFVKHRPISVRFIELMRTGDNLELFQKHHVRALDMRSDLISRGFQTLERGALNGPAEEFSHPDFAGNIGFIAPYSKDFCLGCNRLRVSCRGELKLCLFGDGQETLRDLLQVPATREELKDRILTLLNLKKASHSLEEGKFGNTMALASIGG